MLLASNNLALPVIAPYLRNDPVAVIGPTMPQVVFLLRIGPAVAFFLALAALDHLLVAAPSVHRWYERGLARRANYARWIEYSVSASVMIVLIGCARCDRPRQQCLCDNSSPHLTTAKDGRAGQWAAANNAEIATRRRTPPG